MAKKPDPKPETYVVYGVPYPRTELPESIRDCDQIKDGSRMLPVRLSPAELQTRGADLAKAQRDLEKLTEEKAAISAKIKELEARRSELAVTIEQRQEPRTVDCTTFAQWSRRTAHVVRTDTGEVIDVRPLTREEMQQNLPFEESTEGKLEGAGDTVKVKPGDGPLVSTMPRKG